MNEAFDRIWIREGGLPAGVTSFEPPLSFPHVSIGGASMGPENIEYVRAEIHEKEIDKVKKQAAANARASFRIFLEKMKDI